MENTLRLMAHVGNPQEQLRTVHVAGTNGKGSTSHLIAASLQAAGLRVGLFTSPHLVSLTERIRINGKPIEEEEIAGFIGQNKDFLDTIQPSFFETMTALAFAYFVKRKVDVAVIEVGLGGRLDSTNVLTPVLSVITNIGLDHTEFLGNTLSQIAKEKAGIMKPHVPCVIGETHPRTMNVFLERARECGILGEGLETTDCRIWFADQCGYMRSRRLREVPECELKGIYQEQNQQTAYVALQVLRNYTSLHIPTLQYVARQLKELKNPRIWIVFGMVNDKDTEVVMRLMPSDKRFHYIFTTPNTHRARTALEMLEIWDKKGIAIETPKDAIRFAQQHAAPEDAIFIGGSNYLVGEVLEMYEV